MSTTDFSKIRENYHALSGINKVFEDATRDHPGTVENTIVDEYERFIQQADKELPGLLVPFNKQNFFSHPFHSGNGSYYHYNGIKINIARKKKKKKKRVDESTSTPVTQIKSFHFISDNNIRRILERDYQEIQRSIISSNWKSAIILSGGSIEAILLDMLSRDLSRATSSSKSPNEADINKWDLNDLVEVAVEEKFIGNEVAKLSHTVRDYRNLIHPGVEIRKNLKVEPEEAKIAIEVLHILIRELS